MRYIIYTNDNSKRYKLRGNYEIINNKFILKFKLPIDTTNVNVLLNLPIGYIVKLIHFPKIEDFIYYLKNTNTYKEHYILKSNSIIVLGGKFIKNKEYSLSFNLKQSNDLLIQISNEFIPVKNELSKAHGLLKAMSEENATLQNCYNSAIVNRNYIYREHNELFNQLEKQTTVINDLRSKLDKYEKVNE